MALLVAGAKPTKLAERVAYTPDRAALQAQQSTVQVAHGVNVMPFASGNLLDRDQDAQGKPFGSHTGLPFTASQTRTLSHGLQRVPNGFFLVGAVGIAAALPILIQVGAATSTTITLMATVDGFTAKIWVW